MPRKDHERYAKEHMRLYGETFMAHSYCRAFMGQDEAAAIGELLAAIQKIWKPGDRLTDEQVGALGAANATLRRVYDGAPGRQNLRKRFDEQFTPAVGWQEYFARNLR
ncbi:MAG TPA: hypothetical protein P5114_12800 [Hyphomicrobiaceae bacterium]|nr:hypothetical protein [Hyphomicrobiaceae bacterium]